MLNKNVWINFFNEWIELSMDSNTLQVVVKTHTILFFNKSKSEVKIKNHNEHDVYTQ